MNIPFLAQACMFAAMLSAISSYFVKKKNVFLVVQSLAIILFAFASFFKVNFLPVFTYLIAFVRMIIYYGYEKKDKIAPFMIKTLFAGLNVVAYFVLNAITKTLFNPVDLILLFASVVYAYGFGIRNLQLLRLFFIAPTVASIVYYSLVPGSLFAIISYSFELCANLISLVLYRDKRKEYERKKQKQLKKAQKDGVNE